MRPRDDEQPLTVLWCGTVRCYVLGRDVAVVETTGSENHPRVEIRHLETDEDEPSDAARAALRELLEHPPKGFPLHGLHWIPAQCGGDGPVLREEPPGGLDGAEQKLAREARAVARKLGWVK